MIKVAIVGYGNLGRGVCLAVEKAKVVIHWGDNFKLTVAVNVIYLTGDISTACLGVRVNLTYLPEHVALKVKGCNSLHAVGPVPIIKVAVGLYHQNFHPAVVVYITEPHTAEFACRG